MNVEREKRELENCDYIILIGIFGWARKTSFIARWCNWGWWGGKNGFPQFITINCLLSVVNEKQQRQATSAFEWVEERKSEKRLLYRLNKFLMKESTCEGFLYRHLAPSLSLVFPFCWISHFCCFVNFSSFVHFIILLLAVLSGCLMPESEINAAATGVWLKF